jgi:hypothetical protein
VPVKDGGWVEQYDCTRIAAMAVLARLAGKRDRGRSTLTSVALFDRAAPSRGLARLSSTVFRFAVSANVAYPALDVAYDGLPTVIYMNMLDADVLLSAVTQPSKNLYLHRIRPH